MSWHGVFFGVHVCVCVCVCVCVNTCMPVHVHVCMRVSVYVDGHTFACKCLCVCVCVLACGCITAWFQRWTFVVLVQSFEDIAWPIKYVTHYTKRGVIDTSNRHRQPIYGGCRG